MSSNEQEVTRNEQRAKSFTSIRTNKKYIPKNLAKDQDLERGAFDYRVSKNDIVIYKRKDNKPVHIISNFHGTEPSNVQRKNRDGSVQSIYHVQKLFPTIIYIYGRGGQS